MNEQINKQINRSIDRSIIKTYASMQILDFVMKFCIKTILTDTYTAASWNLLTMEQLVTHLQ